MGCYKEDIDCMPFNPLENMPASLRRHNVGVSKFFENFNELKMNGQLKDRKLEGYMKFASSENMENADGPSHVSPSTYPMSNLLKQAKGGSTSASQSKVGPCETANAQKVSNSQPSILAQIQANEADVQALSALTRALDKKAISSLREGGNSVARIEEAIDYVNNRLSVDESGMPAVRCTPADSVHGGLASQDQVTSCTSNPLVASHAPDPKLNASDQNEAQIPSDLISHCVATLLMIQKCTERQFPPADVAQILESAVTSLQPCCSQNRPIYAEIQKCMGIIRSQILALIPT